MLVLKTFVAVISASLALALPQSIPSDKRSVAFNYGQTPVRGLNIGGWLVLEPWITPSIFKNLDQSLGIVDEFTLTQKLGTAAAYNILKPHWDTWCTFADFQKIQKAGFNTVRIPIGYWAYMLVDGEPYTQGAAQYLDAAIDWARVLGLKIWIDLHGAPGSQNGFDNSGHRSIPVQPQWQKGNTVAQTLQVLQIISARYAQPKYQDVIVAIELLNEPLSPVLDFQEIKDFYSNGFNLVRQTSDTAVVLHDAFVAPSEWNNFLNPWINNAQFVLIDHHEYQVFTPALNALSPAQHRELVCTNAASWSGSDKWLVVGEWTAAMTDCAPFLNGYGIGARYDGSYPESYYVGSCADKSNIATWSAATRDDARGYIEAQLQAFEKKANGWFFWNFKTEAAHEWDAFVLLDNGVFPQPLTDRKFAPVCNNM